jgi:Lrp/AsnC family leucine-responsive transcriptional regulator
VLEKLNRIDKNILRILQENGRISFAELGRQVGLTTTPCIERVKRLEKEGFIKGYSAIVSPDKLDAGLIIFVQIKFDRTSKSNFTQFQSAVRQLDQVQECYLISGAFDYLIKARVANMSAYREFLEDTLLSLPEVKESSSIVVMEAAKETLNIPIPN